MAQRTDASLVSTGYEGADVSDLVDRLLTMRVDVLVDVRLTPLSRKPGLSKNRLAAALGVAGIKYVHLRALGNPKENRDGFRAGSQVSRDRYRELLDAPAAKEALAHVAELLDGGTVALLCFERDHQTCHRGLVSEQLTQSMPGLAVSHI